MYINKIIFRVNMINMIISSCLFFFLFILLYNTLLLYNTFSEFNFLTLNYIIDVNLKKYIIIDVN